MFFSLFQMSVRIRFRQRITKKKHVFFQPSACIALLSISEKNQSISGDKRNILKKNKFISGDEEIFFPDMFFCFFSLSSSLTFFKEIKSFFYFVALINFSKNRFNVMSENDIKDNLELLK